MRTRSITIFQGRFPMQSYTRSRLGALANLNTGVALPVLAVSLGVMLPSAAFAQAGPEVVQTPQDATIESSPETTDESDSGKNIVVTGTLVRGIAPPGASPIAVGQKDIEASGASTVA